MAVTHSGNTQRMGASFTPDPDPGEKKPRATIGIR